jgi:hypothetical protein
MLIYADCSSEAVDLNWLLIWICWYTLIAHLKLLIHAGCSSEAADANWLLIWSFWCKLIAQLKLLLRTDCSREASDVNWLLIWICWYTLIAHLKLLMRTDCSCEASDVNWLLIWIFWYTLIAHPVIIIQHYEVGWCWGKFIRLEFGRLLVWISSGISAVMTAFSWFSWNLPDTQAHRLGDYRLLPNPVQVIIHALLRRAA